MLLVLIPLKSGEDIEFHEDSRNSNSSSVMVLSNSSRVE